jgi:hypothetical protein
MLTARRALLQFIVWSALRTLPVRGDNMPPLRFADRLTLYAPMDNLLTRAWNGRHSATTAD